MAMLDRLPRARVAVTLLSPFIASSEDNKQTNQTKNLKRSAIPIKIQITSKNNNVNKDRNNENTNLRDKDREYLQKLLKKNIDVRYLSNIKSVRDKFIASYQSCNEDECPVMRERWDQHQQQHHSLVQLLQSNPSADRNRRLTEGRKYNARRKKYGQERNRNSPERYGEFSPSSDRSYSPNRYGGYSPNSERMSSPNSDRMSSPNSDRISPDRRFEEREVFSENRDFDLESVDRDRLDLERDGRSPDRGSYRSRYSNPHKTDTVTQVTTKRRYCTESMPHSPCPPLSRRLYSNRNVGTSSPIYTQSKYHTKCNDIHSVQTSSENFGYSRERKSHIKSEADRPIPLKRCRTTNSLSPKRHTYRDNLHREIQKWLEDVPIYPNLNPTARMLRYSNINSLIERINNMFHEINQEDYEMKIKNEIDRFLNDLPMWYPGDKTDPTPFKDNLSNNLVNILRVLNSKYVKPSPVRNATENSNISNVNTIKTEISDWLLKINGNTNDALFNKPSIRDTLINKIMPLLTHIPLDSPNYKMLVKNELIGILDGLPIFANCPKNRKLHITRLAEELSSRIMNIKITQQHCINSHCTRGQLTSFPYGNDMISISLMPGSNLKYTVLEGVCDCLEQAQVGLNCEIEEEITEILVDCLEAVRSGEDHEAKAEICGILQNSGELSERQASNIAELVVKSVRDIITQDIFDDLINKNKGVLPLSPSPSFTKTLSVYTSEHDLDTTNYPVTSTPKRKPMVESKKDVPKLSPEEKAYMNKLSSLIKAWMETLPKKFDAPEEKEFKETIINDLAGDLMDREKLEQLAPETSSQKDKYITYIVYRWLFRFDIFEDLNTAPPQIEDLVKRVKDVTVPKMTRPQQGNRQAMENIKHMQEEDGWAKDFLPKGQDVLEDEISIWMNEQPSEIYSNNDKSIQSKMVHELAEKIKDPLKNKRPENEIKKEVEQWMSKVVKSGKKKDIAKLSEQLKDRVLKVPLDETLARNLENKIKARNTYDAPGSQALASTYVATAATEAKDLDKVIEEFIAKYIQHNYDVDDTLARGAFGHLLKTEIKKLSPLTRKEIYDNFTKSSPEEAFSLAKLGAELQYIKDISDWLKNLPIDGAYNRVGNKQRVEFVNTLAKNIREIEENRRKSPQTDSDTILRSVIGQFVEQLPILPEHKTNAPLMVEQLMNKVAISRKMPCCQKAICSSQQSADISINSTGIEEQNLNDFIEEYIRLNGRDIADDGVKMEAWTSRLMKEIKKMMLDSTDPNTLCKAQVYNRLADIPTPGDETIKRFSNELEYAKEISDWLNNLPLLPATNLNDTEDRARMVSDLAEKMSEIQNKKDTDPNNAQTDVEFQEFVTTWINQLPLDRQKEIVVPMVIQQLINRMIKVNNQKQDSVINTTTTNETRSSSSTDTSKSKSKSKSTSKSLSKSPSKTNKVKSKRSTASQCNKSNPGTTVIEAIEKWCKNLPIKEENETATKTAKDNIAKKIFQKIGELNMDPRIYNDDVLYEDLLTDEIDGQLEKFSENAEIKKKKDTLNKELVGTVMDVKQFIKENSAGDHYKHQLENTIDASIPNPVQAEQMYDPGFEIYKTRLVTMFILDNFDHSDDNVKMKYEKKIKQEIDKFFQSAQSRNAIPLTKDQIYNELYSELFKIPRPDESSIADEVEEVKTRYEIDQWFEGLPLREASGVGELLEWDEILTMLTKQLHEIEKNESKPDAKLHKEITKWLKKLPLLPGNDNSIDEFADKLQERLKSTKDERKCILSKRLSVQDKSKGKGKKDKDKGDKSGKGDSKSKTDKKDKADKNKTDKVDKKGQKESKSKGNLGTSQTAGPSSAGKNWETPPASPGAKKPCCQLSPIPQRKPADIMIEIVEAWCDQLPLQINTPQDVQNVKIMKDDLATKIIIKISELNADPNTFNDDILFEELFDEELEKLTSNLPTCCDFQQSKPARKMQLKDAVKSIKALIKEEKARHDYKEELKNTISSVMEEPLNTTSAKIAEFNELKDEIVNDFVEYNYNKGDDVGKQIYKGKIQDAVLQYFSNIKEKSADEPSEDPLIVRNQLLCELSKIPLPSEAAIKDEILDIRMKNEVNDFFKELPFPEVSDEKMSLRNQMKNGLAKRLNELEKSGHTCANDSKMKSEITRCLRKLDLEVSTDNIEAFVNKLKENEVVRKAEPPKEVDQQQNMSGGSKCQEPCSKGPNPCGQNGQPSGQRSMQQSWPSSQYGGSQPGQEGSTRPLVSEGSYPSQNQPQWDSLLSNSQSSGPRPQWNIPSSGSNQARPLGDSGVNYGSFKSGVTLSSSPPPPTSVQRPQSPVRSPIRQADTTSSLDQTSTSQASSQKPFSGGQQYHLAGESSGPCASTCSSSGLKKPAVEGMEEDPEAVEGEDKLCYCGGRRKKDCRSCKPYCIVHLSYCKDCDELEPVWCGMPYTLGSSVNRCNF